MPARTARPHHRRTRRRRVALAGGVLATVVGHSGVGNAAVYYVSATGSDARPGTSPETAWATTAHANARLRPGDTCRLLPGTYGPIAPAVSGRPGARIQYVGSLADPARVVITGGIVLDASHVSVKGVSTRSGGLGFGPRAAFDSIAYCQMNAPGHGVGFSWSHDNAIVGCRLVGDVVAMDAERPELPGVGALPTRNLFRRNSFTGHSTKFQASQSCVVDSNRFTLTLSGAIPDDQHFRAHYVNRRNLFRDNRWDLTNLTSTVRYAFHVRDSSEFNRWVRDTIVQSPASRADIKCMFATSGAYDRVRSNTYDGLFVKVGDVACQYQQAARADSIVRCVLVSTRGASAFLCDGPAAESLVFVHNTVVSLGGRPHRGVFVQDQSSARHRVVRHNIFYSTATSRRGNSALVFHGPVPAPGNLHDHNLYFAPGGDGAGAAVKVRFDHFGFGGTTLPWRRSALAPDRTSRWGDPRFTVADAAGFDPTPGPGSAAVGAMWPDGHVGAVAPRRARGARTSSSVVPGRGAVDPMTMAGAR